MSTRLSFSDTGYFSKIANDYMQSAEALRPFYAHAVSKSGIEQAIEARQQFSQQRTVLAEQLQLQYKGLTLTHNVADNIAKLNNDNTFTITTAHQPNIFTGPLYMIYKILHVIQLAKYLKKDFPKYDFVPVYYMGSEDADLDEIGQFTVHGKKYVWDTPQTGAVGRMKVDPALLQLLKELKGQIDVEPHGNELTELFASCYTLGKTIQQATLEIMHQLFGKYGLVVLVPDNAVLKKLFEPVVRRELETQFSHPIVEKTSEQLEAAGYKQQASGRALNLFYLLDDRRERIEKEDGKYSVPALNLTFSETEILEELQSHPERFSANVILRGAFQETVLPNIIFVGGGGELAYWLELKNVFNAVQVPYPVLMLRNSFTILDERATCFYKLLQITPTQLFASEVDILNFLSERKNHNKIQLTEEINALKQIYRSIKEKALEASSTLEKHVNALLVQQEKKLHGLEKKMQRQERKKLVTESEWLQYLKTTLFPDDSLQERIENIATLYGQYGKALLDNILTESPAYRSAYVLLLLGKDCGCN
ncbi:MAG: bacillithiol biosynthesis cysteine-adding enzyme BshC [Chitinophagaceae bacterium]